MKLSIFKWITIGLILVLAGANFYFYKKQSRAKKENTELQSVLDSLNNKIISDSLLIYELDKTNTNCTNSAMDKVRYYESKINQIYKSLDKNRKLISDMQREKELIGSGDWNREKIIDFINKNY